MNKTTQSENLLNKRVIVKSDPMFPLRQCQGARGRIVQVIGNRYRIHFPTAEMPNKQEGSDLWFDREEFDLA